MRVPAASIRAGDRVLLEGDGWFTVRSARSGTTGFRHLVTTREDSGKTAYVGLALRQVFTVQRPPGPPPPNEAAPTDEW